MGDSDPPVVTHTHTPLRNTLVTVRQSSSYKVPRKDPLMNHERAEENWARAVRSRGRQENGSARLPLADAGSDMQPAGCGAFQAPEAWQERARLHLLGQSLSSWVAGR